MNSVKVLASRAEWSVALSGFQQYCASSTFGFHYIYQEPQKAHSFLAIHISSKSSRLFYPFMRQHVPHSENLYTISSSYGFSGPLFFGDPKELEGIYSDLDSTLKSLGVIAEFIRLSPLESALSPSLLTQRGYSVTFNRSLAFHNASITKPEETCNMSRRALREGCICRLMDSVEISLFKELYSSTMNLNRASDFFYYSDAYFASILIEPSFDSRIYGVFHGSVLMASAIFLINGNYALYHLGCNSRIIPGCTDLLLRYASCDLYRSGIRLINFTGGRSGDPKDPLLKFKSRFSNDKRPFNIAFRSSNSELFTHYRKLYTLDMPSSSTKLIPWS